MSNARRRSSVQVAERLAPTRQRRIGPGTLFRAKPAFISVLSSRRSGHTRAHAVAQDANRSQHDDQRQRKALKSPPLLGLRPASEL